MSEVIFIVISLVVFFFSRVRRDAICYCTINIRRITRGELSFLLSFFLSLSLDDDEEEYEEEPDEDDDDFFDEEGEGAAAGGDGSGGATSTSSVASETTRGDLGYDVPVFQVQRRVMYAVHPANKKKKSTNPILGKTITAESKKSRRIFVTEEQWNRILEEEGLGAGGATTTTSVASETTRGDLGYDVPFLGSKGDSDFMEPAMERDPGFSVERIGEKKKK